MHLKSCSKLLRSELRLDLSQQQGALLRRGQSNRLPLATLSPNTPRCSQQGGANTLRCPHGGANTLRCPHGGANTLRCPHGGANTLRCPHGGAVLGSSPRAKGTENSGFTEEAPDVFSVIRPGHVREKIALFAHDSDRNAKGSWDVAVKRRRRMSQIQLQQVPPPSVTVTLQPTTRDPPSDPSPPLTAPLTPPPNSEDPKLSVVEMVAFLEQRVTCSPHAKLRSSASITLTRAPPPSQLSPAPAAPTDRPVAAEEPESLSVSDMVAKLESQCLRRRSPGERRAGGHRAVGRVLLAEQHSAPQPISSSKTIQSPPPPSQARKSSEVKLKAGFPIKAKVLKTLAASQAPPTSPYQRSDAIGRGKTETPPCSLSSQMKESKSETVLFFCKAEKTLREKTKTLKKRDSEEAQKTAAAILTLSVHPEATDKTKSSSEAKQVQVERRFSDKDSAKSLDVEKLDCDRISYLIPPNLSLPSQKSENLPPHEEPLPGLLFLTPPPKLCIQSEPDPASPSPRSSSESLVPSHRMTKADRENSFVVLSLDLTIQSRTRTSPTPDSSSSPPGQSEKRKDESCDLAVQPEESKPHGAESDSERTCLEFTEGFDQSQRSATSEEKSCPATETELGVQSETGAQSLFRIPALEPSPPESQSQQRLSRIVQSPQPSSSDCSDGQSEASKRLSRPATEQWDIRVGGAVLLRSSSDVGGERRRRRKAARALSLCEGEGAWPNGEGARRAVSEDFLLMRRRVQSLLEPRMQVSYLSLLPHHLLLHILLLLPTRALAALKCSCRYLRLIIDEYDPRPLDALWVCDPRYRDDPCKQCKRRRGRGDVSLCRWHHKPFCQAMPYGPGYWMCCHGNRRDAPGCNVGRHDNRWVPEFHSINSPVYRQRREEPEE